jgi:hypothetical protein
MPEQNFEILKYDTETKTVIPGKKSEDRFRVLLENALNEAKKRCKSLGIFVKSLREQEKNSGHH